MPTSDAGAPIAGGERGAMPASTSHPRPKIEAAKAVLKLVLLLTAVQGAKLEDQEKKEGEEESFEEPKIFMVVFSLLVVVRTVVVTWMWKVGVSHVLPLLPAAHSEDGRSRPAEVDATLQAEEPGISEEVSAVQF